MQTTLAAEPERVLGGTCEVPGNVVVTGSPPRLDGWCDAS
jgi:hypothetical protein